jgi:hypothetical protein
MGQQALCCRHLVLVLRPSCPNTKGSKSCGGWGCAPCCEHLALGLHVPGARARLACLAADPSERVFRTARLGSGPIGNGPKANGSRVRTQFSWVIHQDPLVMNPRLMSLVSEPNSLVLCVMTQLSWIPHQPKGNRSRGGPNSLGFNIMTQGSRVLGF